MKVLHVITDLYTGGSERALLNLLAGGLADHFDSHVLNLREETGIGIQIAELGVPVINVGMASAIAFPQLLWQIRKSVKKLQPDVVQGWMYHGNLAASVASSMCDIQPALIWNVRQTLYSIENEKPLTRQVIRANKFLSSRPQKILYNSRLSQTQHEAIGFALATSQVIPNGINLAAYVRTEEDRQCIRAELGIKKSSVVFGHVARLHPMKNHAGFVRAAVQAADWHPDAEFLLVGAGVTSDNKALTTLVPDALRTRFHFLGERQDIPAVMNALDVFCLSSVYGEAFPNVLGEAMATGLPCVVTDVGDCAFILGDAGIILPANDDAAMLAAINKMVIMPTSGRLALGEAARSRVEKNYTLTSAVNQYIDLYTSIEHRGCNS